VATKDLTDKKFGFRRDEKSSFKWGGVRVSKEPKNLYYPNTYTGKGRIWRGTGQTGAFGGERLKKGPEIT